MKSRAPRHRVYAAVNRPSTILYADRRLFLTSVVGGFGLYLHFHWLLGGLLFFLVGYLIGVSVVRIDPRLPEIVLLSAACSERYDPAKPDKEG